MTQTVSLSCEKKPIVDTNQLSLEDLWFDIDLRQYIRKSGVGAVDLFVLHEDVNDFRQIASYNTRRQQLTWKPAVVIFKSKSKDKNNSLVCDILLKPKQSGGSDHKCEVSILIWSITKISKMQLAFNPSSKGLLCDGGIDDEKPKLAATAISGSWQCETCMH